MYSIQVGLYGPLEVRALHVRSMMDATIEMDLHEFDAKPFPWLYDCVRKGLLVYKTSACTEDACTDVPWEDPWTCLARGWTDCKNLVKWRIVELKKRLGLAVGYRMNQGFSASRDVLFHPVVVGFWNGQVREEDPSELSGMGQEGSVLSP